ncbi:hypothetical protein FOZ62_032050 [Perkinsus olseni]|uniref:Uncharacterized protein n=1 Tax=Perkinsus olseni TaxID=32597 RepID=A0A7J6QHF4_PEROL|nr:hypothetical protein FOZ62_032050 [Perkinsus olseni]
MAMQQLGTSKDIFKATGYWSLLKRAIYRHDSQFDTTDKPWCAVQKAAKEATAEDVRKLTRSMDRQAVKKVTAS